jgi:hypothetical protein
MIIAIDFDGTVVTHEWPKIGTDVGAEPILRQLVENGHLLILWTMRSGPELDAAVEWFKIRDIPLYGANKNPDQHWSTSPKAYAQLYIDDAALGMPLIRPAGKRPYVDWRAVEAYLEAHGILSREGMHGRHIAK